MKEHDEMPTLFWFLLGMFIGTTAGIFAMGLCAACRFPTTPLMEDEDRTTLSQNF
jgi:hypothetical protein